MVFEKIVVPTPEPVPLSIVYGDIKGAYWISSNYSFIQYCDSNIGLFSIAPPLVIALLHY